MIKKITLVFCCTFLLSFTNSFGQIFSNKEVGKKNQAAIDSLKASEYPYVLPIWGKQATAAGFSLPYSAGLGINYLWQESSITISNLEVGFNNGPMYNIDDIVRFDDAISTASIINFRPDIWLFPFLNVYGIFTTFQSSTQVDFGIWVPDSTTFTEVTSASTTANFNGNSLGFGLTPTIGVGGGWLALDMNFTWSDIDALDQPAFGFVFAPRFGKTFRWFKNPERNVNFWVGGFRLRLDTRTSGSLPLNELVNFDEAGQKIEEGQQGIADASMRLEDWWSGLSDPEQVLKEPIYNRAREALNRANQVLTDAEGAVSSAENSTVQYSLDKQQTALWNLIVGAQYQHNKHWMIRSEVGFLGTRTQVLVGLQYRFGL